MLCSRCCGRDDDDLYLLAAAFEYLHVATRCMTMSSVTPATARQGDSGGRFGVAAAILAGDWLHAYSMA